MGKIFGISDNPVSTIGKVTEPYVFKNPDIPVDKLPKVRNTEDKFVPSQKPHSSNPIVAMRNGFGKLMSHFSKKR